ncbi:MAG: bifunctional diaminohydroxyphosphoribosylaminopyrimidine deaminase/5-amino-6-(5-phosphoribosylamino)uracil reductase RibD [Pirellulales bacterium]
MTRRANEDGRFMALALALAMRGEGHAEPNPMVGCVIARDGEVIGEGYHERFGSPHAEVMALSAAGEAARGATAYVSLEPCCHHGKTPPCTQALVRAGVARVVVAMEDPYPQVAGKGIAELRGAGVPCDVGVLAGEARQILAPYLKRVTRGRPWVIAKWAMTLDGRLATRTGDSQWISSELSRSVVHQIRGRVDAVMVGSGTARTDNPLLTARPLDRFDRKRIATRIVVDSSASLSLDSRLVQSANDLPVLVAVATGTPDATCRKLTDAGVEVLRCLGDTHEVRMCALFDELGRREFTNVLIEGGSRLLGTLFNLGAVDEVHVFIAPKIAGGVTAPGPIGGPGVAKMADALALGDMTIEELAGDVYVHGRIRT